MPNWKSAPSQHRRCVRPSPDRAVSKIVIVRGKLVNIVLAKVSHFLRATLSSHSGLPRATGRV